MEWGNFNMNTPQVTVAAISHLGDNGAGGVMQQANSLDADANMAEADDLYGDVDQLGAGPYYGVPRIDPNLSNLLDDDMANIDLQAGEDDISPTQEYGGDLSSAAATPSKPKRAPAKRTSSNRTNGKKKQPAPAEEFEPQAATSEEENDAEPEDDDSDDFAPEPVVPKKSARKTTRTPSKRKPATPKTPKSAAKTPTKPRKSARKSTAKSRDELPFNRQRRAPKNGITEARPIPRNYEECDAADRALIDARDKDQKTWREIRGIWESMTGQKTGTSTVPNRYERLKDNFSIIKEEDRPRLLEAKEEVEREMNAKKWTLIAEKIKESGGDRYAPDNLQRQYKKLMVKEGIRPPPGIVDPDFQIWVSEDEVDDDDDE